MYKFIMSKKSLTKFTIVFLLLIGLIIFIFLPKRVESLWWEDVWANYRNISISNTSETPGNYSVILTINTTTPNFGHICGIRIMNGTNQTVRFAFQDNGNATLDAGENITIRVPEQGFPATQQYTIYYNNQSFMDCANESWNNVYYLLYDDFSTNTGYWTKTADAGNGTINIDTTVHKRLEYVVTRDQDTWAYYNFSKMNGKQGLDTFEFKYDYYQFSGDPLFGGIAFSMVSEYLDDGNTLGTSYKYVGMRCSWQDYWLIECHRTVNGTNVGLAGLSGLQPYYIKMNRTKSGNSYTYCLTIYNDSARTIMGNDSCVEHNPPAQLSYLMLVNSLNTGTLNRWTNGTIDNVSIRNLALTEPTATFSSEETAVITTTTESTTTESTTTLTPTTSSTSTTTTSTTTTIGTTTLPGWLNTSYANYVNLTIHNDSQVLNPIRLELTATDLIPAASLPVRVWGIWMINDSNLPLKFAFQDDGDSFFEVGENITIVEYLGLKFADGGNITIFYNNNTPVSYSNSSWNKTGWFEDFEDDTIGQLPIGWTQTEGATMGRGIVNNPTYAFGNNVFLLESFSNRTNPNEVKILVDEPFPTLKGNYSQAQGRPFGKDAIYIAFDVYAEQTQCSILWQWFTSITGFATNTNVQQYSMNYSNNPYPPVNWYHNNTFNYDTPYERGWTYFNESGQYGANMWYRVEYGMNFTGGNADAGHHVLCVYNYTGHIRHCSTPNIQNLEPCCGGPTDVGINNVSYLLTKIPYNSKNPCNFSIDNIIYNYNESRKENLGLSLGSEQTIPTVTTTTTSISTTTITITTIPEGETTTTTSTTTLPKICTNYIYNFSDGSAVKNMSFTANENKTIFINIPKYSDIQTGYINISGFNYTYPILYDTEKNVGYDVFPWSNPLRVHDNDWTTYGEPSEWSNYQSWAIFYANYTIPGGAINASILYKHKFGHACVETCNIKLRLWNYTSNSYQNLENPWLPEGVEYNRTFNITTLGDYDNEGVLMFNISIRSVNPLDPARATWLYETAVNFTVDSNITNPYLDVSGDGDKEWYNTGRYNYTNNRTSNFFSEINDYLYSCVPVSSNCTIPLVFHSDSIGIIQANDVNITYCNDYVVYTQEYNSSLTSSDNAVFVLRIMNNTIINNATLVWNGTHYPSTYQRYASSVNYTTILNPVVLSDETISFYWNFFVGGNERNTTTKSQTIYSLNVTNCSDGGSIIYRFRFYNETNLQSMNADMDITLNMWAVSGMSNHSFAFRNGNNYSICVYPALTTNLTVNAQMDYWNGTEYEHRSYYYYHASISNTTINQSLYLITDGDSDMITFTIKDAAANLEEDVYVKVQRYYLDTNTYRTVVIGKSDYLGQFITYLTSYDIWYRFILEKDGSVLQSINPMKIASNEITLMVEASGILEWYKYNDKISYACEYNNETFNIVCSATDISGYVTRFCLNATEMKPNNSTTLCEICDSSSSVTLSCYVGNATGRMIYYTLTAGLNFNPIDLTTIWHALLEYGKTVSPIFQLHGVFAALIVSGSISFTALWKPAIAMILLIGSLVALSLFGIITIPWAVIIGLVFMAGIIIYKVST